MLNDSATGIAGAVEEFEIFCFCKCSFLANAIISPLQNFLTRATHFPIRFQDCIARLRTFSPSTAMQDRIETNLNLLHLSQDFIYAATTYGKIIISEYYLPFEKKTIKPCSLPGVR